METLKQMTTLCEGEEKERGRNIKGSKTGKIKQVRITAQKSIIYEFHVY